MALLSFLLFSLVVMPPEEEQVFDDNARRIFEKWDVNRDGAISPRKSCCKR